MRIRFYRFFSYVFHPIMLPTYVGFLMLEAYPMFMMPYGVAFKWEFLTLVILFYTITPVFIVFGLRKVHWIDSIEYHSKNQRLLLGTIHVAYMLLLLAFTSYIRLPIPEEWLDFTRLIVYTSAVSLLVSRFTTISLHALGVLSITFFFFWKHTIWAESIDVYVCCSWVILSGMTASARLYLGAHTLIEILKSLFISIVVVLWMIFH